MGRKGYVRKTLDKKAPSTAFKPGDPRINRRGRIPVAQGGTPNRINRDIKEMVLSALEKAGGENWFIRLAKAKDKRTFAQLVAKLMPTRLAGHDGGPLDAQVQTFQSGLANLNDAELEQFQALMKKITGPKGTPPP